MLSVGKLIMKALTPGRALQMHFQFLSSDVSLHEVADLSLKNQLGQGGEIEKVKKRRACAVRLACTLS
jgi:hypothetical protein